MPTDDAPGQVSGGAGETPITPPSTPPTDGQLPAASAEDDEEPFDRERAMRTIRTLRAEAKKATAAIKELDQLRADRQRAEDSKLGDLERRDKRIQQLEADMALSKQDAQDRINHYEVQLQASRLGIVDPDAAVKLLSWGDLEYGDDGRPKDVDKALRQLLKDKPYLAAQAAGQQVGVSVGNPATRGTSKPGEHQYTRSQLATMSYEEYSRQRDAVRRAMQSGQILPD